MVSKRPCNFAGKYIAFRLQYTKFSVLRLIPCLWCSYYLKFQHQNSKFQIKIRNSKFMSMHLLILNPNLQSVTSCLTFSDSVPMHVMRKYSVKPSRISTYFLLFYLEKSSYSNEKVSLAAVGWNTKIAQSIFVEHFNRTIFNERVGAQKSNPAYVESTSFIQ